MKLNYPYLKAKIILICLFYCTISDAQQLHLLEKKTFQKDISAYCTDSKNNYYLAFDGSIEKYNNSNQLISRYSIPAQATISSMAVWNTFKLFAFSKIAQEITVLDRFTSVPKNYKLLDFSDNFISATCPSTDGNVWIIESNPQVFKKINLLTNQVLSESQLPIEEPVSKIFNYQNLIFLTTDSLVFLLDQYASIIKKWKIAGVNTVQFYENQLFFITKNQLFQVSLTKDKIQKVATFSFLPNGAFANDNSWYLIHKNAMSNYKLLD